MKKSSLLFVVLVMFSINVMAKKTNDVIKLVKVTENIYAIVGSLGNRSKQNLGNNATFGFVVTKAGVVLIDPGATYEGAEKIYKLIQTVTTKPIKFVINSGGQDHRWLGNDYFKKKGATIIASKEAVVDQKHRVQEQFLRLGNLIGAKAIKRTNPVYADKIFESKYEFKLGGINFNVIHAGPAHTPGDSFIWLADQKVVFSGDIVYTQRMLSISDHSNSKSWLAAFNAIAVLKPRYVIPGHGTPTTLDKAKKDSYDYIAYLRKLITEFIEVGGGIENIGKLDQQQFSYLKNYKNLKGRNAQQVFQEIEFE